jgi:hypothetical protein
VPQSFSKVQDGFAAKVTMALFSVQPLCSLCLCGVFLLGIHLPQRHREHRGCTEKSQHQDFEAKPFKTLVKAFALSIVAQSLNHQFSDKLVEGDGVGQLRALGQQRIIQQ